MGRWFLVLVALGACGRIGFGVAGGEGVDAGDDAGSGADASCTFSAWSAPQRVDELSTGSAEYGGQITADGLAYYFRSDRNAASDLFVARRPDRASTFGAATSLTALNSTSEELDIAVSADELEVYFTSDRGGGGFCLMYASRAAVADPFSGITQLDALCAGTPGSGAYVTADGLTLFYTRMDGVNYEGTLMRTTRASTGIAFTAGAPIAELDGSFDMGYPVLSGDGLTLYFDGGAVHHLFQATRPDVLSPWGNVIEIPGMNSTAIDEDVSVTADGLELYFGSGRLGGPDDIFRATRTCL